MKKYIYFEFDENGYITLKVIHGDSKYAVADNNNISRNNVYPYDLIDKVFKWLYDNTDNDFYFIVYNKYYLYMTNRKLAVCEPVHKMVTIKKAIKLYNNR